MFHKNVTRVDIKKRKANVAEIEKLPVDFSRQV